jgi:3-isopropylmalate dehydrogenase
MLKIGYMLGDDIGLEVVPETVKVMRAAALEVGLDLDWREFPLGRKGHELHGHTMPEATVAGLRETDGFITGPIGHNAYPRNDPTWIMPPVRKRFDMYANVKPVKSYENIESVHKNVDIVFLREVTEGMQASGTVVAGSGEFRPNDEISIGSRVVTRKGASRVAREAFEIARTRSRRKVTAVHKEPVYRLVCGMFAEECRKMATNYPDVELEEVLVDGFAMKLVMKPQQYDVVVTTNQFGDILTDEGAGLVGGLGLAPGLVVGDQYAMAQATHGSAPDIAGKNIANPYAMVMSGKMLFEWLGRKKGEPKATAAAKLIDHAMDDVISEAKSLTVDLGGKASTTEMGDAIVDAVRRAGRKARS